MSSRGSSDRGKMPMTRGRERLIQLADLAIESERRHCHRQSTNQYIVPIQPTPPVQTTPEAFMMISTLGYIPPHVSKGESSHRYTQEPQIVKLVPQLPQVEEEVQEEHKPPQDLGPYKLDTDGKIIIRPYARGWTPSLVAVDAIKSVIQTQFQGPFHCWSETPRDMREYWWKLFKEKVSWDPRDHGYIKKMFQQRGAKCLSNMLTKARKKGMRPNWIREEAWSGLIAHWESQAFKKVLNQNKSSHVSDKGGTMGHKAHFDVALSMVCIHSEQATKNAIVHQDIIAACQDIIAARQDIVAARQDIIAARQDIIDANQIAAEVNQRHQHLEEQFRTMMDRMEALERQFAGASASASRAHQGHPHHDEPSPDYCGCRL